MCIAKPKPKPKPSQAKQIKFICFTIFSLQCVSAIKNERLQSINVNMNYWNCISPRLACNIQSYFHFVLETDVPSQSNAVWFNQTTTKTMTINHLNKFITFFRMRTAGWIFNFKPIKRNKWNIIIWNILLFFTRQMPTFVWQIL